MIYAVVYFVNEFAPLNELEISYSSSKTDYEGLFSNDYCGILSVSELRVKLWLILSVESIWAESFSISMPMIEWISGNDTMNRGSVSYCVML